MIALGCGLTFRASNMSYLFVGFQIIPLFFFFPHNNKPHLRL